MTTRAARRAACGRPAPSSFDTRVLHMRICSMSIQLKGTPRCDDFHFRLTDRPYGAAESERHHEREGVCVQAAEN
jgi:hypothetical protein